MSFWTNLRIFCESPIALGLIKLLVFASGMYVLVQDSCLQLNGICICKLHHIAAYKNGVIVIEVFTRRDEHTLTKRSPLILGPRLYLRASFIWILHCPWTSTSTDIMARCWSFRYGISQACLRRIKSLRIWVWYKFYSFCSCTFTRFSVCAGCKRSFA